MRSKTSILALEWMPVSVAGGVRKAVGGFLRYVTYRDQHPDSDGLGDLDAYMRYVAHRDRTSPRGRIFGRDGVLTAADRQRLVDFVARSTNLKPSWRRNHEGELVDRQRAVYQMILSPEDWRGLDLRRLARAAIRQLEEDAGEKGLGPWFAAEHRNTEHHHVHVVLAARREVEPGKYSTLLITRRRLQRMKDAIALEINHQREREMSERTALTPAPSPTHASPTPVALAPARAVQGWRWLPPRRATSGKRIHTPDSKQRVGGAVWTLFHLRAVALRYRDQMERELEHESARAEREGWVL